MTHQGGITVPEPISVAILCGNLRPNSRTLSVARQVREAVIATFERAGMRAKPGEAVDLALLADDVFAENGGVRIAAALDAVTAADIVIVASPTYMATYSGLLKAVLDTSGRQPWSGVIALPVQVAATPRHALAVELHLRPLLVELGAVVPRMGLFVQESEFGQPGLPDKIASWLQTFVVQLAKLAAAERPVLEVAS